jgi:hypothetical protein
MARPGWPGWWPAAWSWSPIRPRCGWCRDPARAAGGGAGRCGVHGAAGEPGPGGAPPRPGEEERRRRGRGICCLLALDQYAELRKLIPHGETGTELRAIARDDERAARDERRISNRLRADLLAVFPAAIGITAGDLGAPVFLQLLQRWPPADALAQASREELEDFAPSARHGWPGRFADNVTAALAEPGWPRGPNWPAPRPAPSPWPPPSCC